jgi:hypothetical protein
MTNILLPMDQYISKKNTLEKGRDLWVPSSSLGGLSSSLIERFSLLTMEEMENGEEKQWPIPSRGEWNDLLQWCFKASKRKRDSQRRILAA